MISDTFHYHPDVAQALGEQGPVVALESTVITHGLPYPQNVASALAMETGFHAFCAVQLASVYSRLPATISA